VNAARMRSRVSMLSSMNKKVCSAFFNDTENVSLLRNKSLD
jgi:hypothetical protein